MAQLFHLDHDANNWSEYSTSPTTSGISLAAGAALNGTSYGVDVTGSSSGIGARRDFTGVNTSTQDMNIGFYFDINDVDVGSGETLTLITLGTVSSSNPVDIRITNTGSGEFFRVVFSEDSTTLDSSVISSGEHTFELRITREVSNGSADGTAEIFIDGSSEASDTTVENYLTFTGADQLADADCELRLRGFTNDTITGSFYIDEITVRDDSTPIFNNISYLWHHNGTSWEDISDATWANPVNGIVVKKGDSFDTVIASVGADIELTTDRGATAYTTRDTLSFTPGGIAGLVGDNGLDVVAYKGSTGGAVRVEKTVNAESGTVTTENLTSDHSTGGSGNDIAGIA